MPKYVVFVRNWWKRNPNWPNGIEPDPTARKIIIGHYNTQEEARYVAKQYNATHDPGPLSRKAEFDEV